MAGSLAFDRDLEFTAADLARVKAAYPGGPQGVFLKRVRDASGTSRLVYAKAAALSRVRRAARAARRHRPWPAAAERARIPRRALAGLRGAAALRTLRRRPRPGTLALVGLGVVPVYLLWQTPEVFNLALGDGRPRRVPARPVATWPRSCSGSRRTRSPRTWLLRCRCCWRRSSPRARAGGAACSRRPAGPCCWVRWWPRASASASSSRASSTTRAASARPSTTATRSSPA